MESNMKKISWLNLKNGQGLVEYALLLALLVIGLILVLSLSGTSLSDLYCNVASGIGGGKACNEQKVYCQDSFDGDTSGWQNVSGAPKMQNGQMCFPNSMQVLNKCSTKMTQSDYVINLNGITLTQGNGYGVYFRSTLTSSGLNGYAFQYDPGAGNALLIRSWINGREVISPIARVPINSTIYNVPHDFKIVTKGDTFTVYMDGVQVMTAQDGTYPTGGVGLRSWDSTSGCFNNFSIGQAPQ
jgi:Flp pilus assembly pilin Flp